MAHHTDPDLLNHVLQLLTEQGSTGFAEGIRLLVNEAMRVERHQVLQAQPYERTDTRQGCANGYKPKTLTRRVGPITFSVPQVRGETSCYPSALEKGIPPSRPSNSPWPKCMFRASPPGLGEGEGAAGVVHQQPQATPGGGNPV